MYGIWVERGLLGWGCFNTDIHSVKHMAHLWLFLVRINIQHRSQQHAFSNADAMLCKFSGAFGTEFVCQRRERERECVRGAAN